MRLAAQRYVAQRIALIGDAAHVVHPLAGQGVNLGLLDAAALVQEIRTAVAAREDPGALRVLRAYERWRKSEVATMAISIDTFDRLLAHGAGPLARLAQRGLSWVNASQELRRLAANVAAGAQTVEVHGLDNLKNAGPNPIIALNHVSFLDAALAVSLL